MIEFISVGLAFALYLESKKGGEANASDRNSDLGVDSSELAEPCERVHLIRGLRKADQVSRKTKQD